MHSVLVCGRFLTRALVSSAYNYGCSCSSSKHLSSAAASDVESGLALLKKEKHDLGLNLRLLTTCCGFPKDWNGFSTTLIRHGKFGDDACFVTRSKCADVLGVADGVGGWRTYGIDPSVFSYTLMKTCERLVQMGRFNPECPAGIIAAGYYELRENKEYIIGSSTACVLVLNHANQTMYTANIGDSGFLVVRRGQVVHRSEEQTHYFNTPFQLSLPPPGVSDVLNDSPETADTSSFAVQEGDLILLATDGLFDNLPERDIVKQLAMLRDRKMESIQQVVNSLTLQARRLAFNSGHLSPFALRARENGINIRGGKPDDITVLLASVGLEPHEDTVICQNSGFG